MKKILVNKEKAIRLLKEMRDLWYRMDWDEQFAIRSECNEESRGIDMEWYELFEVDNNIELIDNLFIQIFGED